MRTLPIPIDSESTVKEPRDCDIRSQVFLHRYSQVDQPVDQPFHAVYLAISSALQRSVQSSASAGGWPAFPAIFRTFS